MRKVSEAVRGDVAKGKATESRMMHTKQLGREGRHRSVMAHADDRKRQVLLVAHRLVREEERDCAFELTHPQLSRRGPNQLQEPPDKLPKLHLHAVSHERRVGIDAFDFLDVETDLPDPVGDIEVKHPVGMV